MLVQQGCSEKGGVPMSEIPAAGRGLAKGKGLGFRRNLNRRVQKTLSPGASRMSHRDSNHSQHTRAHEPHPP